MATGIDKTLSTPTVLVTGASSQIGVFVIPRLLQAGFHVLALGRKGRPEHYPVLEGVQWLTDIDKACDEQAHGYLVSAGPMELAYRILKAGKPDQSAVIFSSSSVITKQNSADTEERNQVRNMLNLESELASISANRGLKLVILRPTMIYGCGLDTNISRLARWICRFGFLPLSGKATGLRQPVHADDLAAVAVTALLHKEPLPPDLAVVGGSTLSYVEMVSRIFSALNKPVRILRLPQWLFVLLVNLLGIFKPDSAISSEMVRRQAVDLVFDDTQARELLGYQSRSFKPTGKDFSLPD